MQVFTLTINFFLRMLIGIIESSGLSALDACCACGGGTYFCSSDYNLELSFYGRCNCIKE